MKAKTAEALTKAILHGEPGAKPFTVHGYDMYGNPVSEVVDPSKSLADLIEEKTGRRVPVTVIPVKRD